MKPILRWQYNEIEGELALLQGHLSDPSCPCESEGEHCPRKHYMLIKKLATETLAMESNDAVRDRLLDVASQAREFQLLEEQKLCGAEIDYPADPLKWARQERKYFEGLLVGSCELQHSQIEEVAVSSNPAPAHPSGCELVELVRDKCHSQSSWRTTKGCDLYLTELFGQECRGQIPGHILGKLYQVEATCELVSSRDMHLISWFRGYEAEALFAIETEEKGRKIDEVMKKLQDGIKAILESKNYQQYLLTMSKFHRYSLGNIILITVQRPDASRVAGYVTWKELRRWVKKGEKGIAILAPCLPPKPKEPEIEEEELLEPEPRPIYFKVVYVFDVKQTEGEELPAIEVPTLVGEVSEAFWQRLLDYAANRQVSVGFEGHPELDPDIKGYWDPLKNEIWIKPDESRAQQAKTLTHELAHHDTEPQSAIKREDHETIAESVAFSVCAHFGFDTGVRSFPYVALWAKDMDVLRRNLTAVRKVTTGMIEAMEVLSREKIEEVAMSSNPENPAYQPLPRDNMERIEGELHNTMRLHAETVDQSLVHWYEGKINTLLDVVWWFGRQDDDRPYVEWAKPYIAYLQAAEGRLVMSSSSKPGNPWTPPSGAYEHPEYYEVDGSFLSKVHGVALSKCEVEHELAGKLDSCITKVQERNVEKGCPTEGLGTAECPLSYAVCRASISQPICSTKTESPKVLGEASMSLPESCVLQEWRQPTWCPGVAAADKELKQAGRLLTNTKSRLTDIRKNLSTALNICAGQAEMFEQPIAVLDPYGSRCRSPETGQWVPSDECGFEPIGIKTTALGAGGLTHYDFEFHVVEGHSLVVSHDPFTFVPNPDYPKNLQPRLRERVATKAQVEKIAANIEPDALLTDFHVIDRGTPIIGPDLVVEAGNGRVMALLRAYESHPESYRNYYDRLVERIRDFGLRPQDVAKVSLPILVRIRLTEVDRTAFTQEANAMATIAPSAIENARTDAEKITIGMIKELRVSEDESIEDALRTDKNLPFARRFLQTLPDEVQASLVDAKGRLNRDGVHRMAMAIFVSAFQGDNGLRLAEKAFESIDMDIRNTINAIARSLGSIAQAEGLIRSGDRDSELTIGDDLAQAVSVYSAIKTTPALTVEKYLAQEQMFERELTDFQEGILIVLEKYRRSPKKLGRVFTTYAEGVIASPPPAQSAMFPEIKISKQKLWEKALGQAEREPEAPSLFQADPVLNEISRQICSMGQREHGFTICSRGGELLRGLESVGHRHGVTLDISCPRGSEPIGTYHSHPSDPALSEQDKAEMVRLGLPVACIGVPNSGVACYLVSRCGA